MTFVDLTHKISDGMPVFPGDPAVRIEPAASFDVAGNLGHALSIGTHTGTHIDAPAHILHGGKTLDRFPTDKLIGRGKYLRVSGPEIDLDAVKSSGVEAGDILIIDTGTAARFGQPDYYSVYPVLTEDAARYLAATGIRMVGADVCSFDKDKAFPVHKILLENDVLIIENLTQLQDLAAVEFKIYALPLRLDLDGAPARVIAEIL